MSESYGLLAEQEAFTAVARALSAMLEDGDEHVEFRASMTIPVSALKVRVFNPSGRREMPEGRYNTPTTPDEVGDALEVLRAASYRPGAGTWFSIFVVVQASGGATAEYNYDQEADWDDAPIDPICYLQDQEIFPTDEDKQPEWLNVRLAEGRARLAARDKS
ncbi:hypothetical protein [Cryobacterium sp. PH31-O1]|uniref:hypothetical protein n=1 Tax=Cryobacterium sp. PH31-O1 TaxID=3046306 RepID=UPI0024B95A6E|nr:hypothetical protein [Cryobacterium sp. PH31-O1]MDJ0338527.1 hypothetical protein [Cryobacterium sp. PH31-O1]